MPFTDSTAPQPTTALMLADFAPPEVRVLLDLEVSEHVVYGFSCALELPADVAGHLIAATQGERSGWANDNEDEWLDELPIAGAGGLVEITERTAVCHGVRTIPAETAYVRQDRAHLAAAVRLVSAELADEARERFEALVLDAGLRVRCECGWNLALDQTHCGKCRRPAPAS